MERSRVVRAAAAVVSLLVVIWGAAQAWSRPLPVAEPLVVSNAYRERVDTLRRNQTLSHLFAEHNISGAELVSLLAAAEGLNPRRVQAGQEFTFRYPLHGSATPDRVVVRLGDERLLKLYRDSVATWRGESEDIAWTVHVELAAGVIESSLYETLHDVIEDSILPYAERTRLGWDLADGVFGWVIDFTRDLYPDDRVELVYERLTSGLGDVRYGRVVAVRLTTRGSPNSGYVLDGDDGGNEYYDADGESLRRAFKLYPVSFRYISSGFSRSRVHPILRVRRPHLGVDYRARRGAPVSATGDGVVQRAGRWGGYGTVVTIRHPKGIETRYAHLRGLASGIRAGARVKQGQTIGYVGMTGLATAPHVHYEFIKNGRHTDPRQAVKFGPADPVPPLRRDEFERVKRFYDRLLDELSPHFTSTEVD